MALLDPFGVLQSGCCIMRREGKKGRAVAEKTLGTATGFNLGSFTWSSRNPSEGGKRMVGPSVTVALSLGQK